MSGGDLAGWAAEILAARAAGRLLDQPITSRAELTLDESYQVQALVTAARLARGERVVGWKLGYTSVAMREQMGVNAPNYGPLTDAMLLANAATVPERAVQPRVEPEIGLRFARRLTGTVDVAEVLGACDVALACLEVVDSVWAGYRFAIEDNTADGSSAAWVTVGAELPLDDLAGIAVTVSVDDEVVAEGTGAAAGGHPAVGVAWLAAQLGRRGRAIEAGDLVITGGLTRAVALAPGGRVRADFDVPDSIPVGVAVDRTPLPHRGSPTG